MLTYWTGRSICFSSAYTTQLLQDGGRGFTNLSIAATRGLRGRSYGIVFIGHQKPPPPEGTPSRACALQSHRLVSTRGTFNWAAGGEDLFKVMAGYETLDGEVAGNEEEINDAATEKSGISLSPAPESSTRNTPASSTA